MRRGALIAAAAVSSSLLAAPTAGAASFGGDQLEFTIGQAMGKVMKRQKVKLRAIGTTTVNGRRAVFSLGEGSATLAAPITGTLPAVAGAGVRFRKGKRKVNFLNISEVLAGSRASLKSGSLTLFKQSPGTRIGPNSDFTHLIGTRVPLRLTKSGANRLNRRLKLKGRRKFRRNQKAGSLSFDAARRIIVASGKSTVQFNSSFSAKLAGPPPGGCSVIPSANAPATNTGPGRYEFPVRPNSSRVRAENLFGDIQHDGGLHFDYNPDGPSAADADLQEPVLSNSSAPVITAFATDQNQRAPLADLDMSTATQSKNMTATSASYNISGATMKLSSIGTVLLNQKCQATAGVQPFVAGETIGTADTEGSGQ